MRRWLIYGAVLLAMVTVKPFRGTDIAKLQPVEVLSVAMESGKVRLQTDTGNSGVGETFAAALRDLRETTPGEVFLETADYLVLSAEATALLPELTSCLRPGCAVCIGLGFPDLKAVGSFLRAHPPKVSLRHYRAQKSNLPILVARGEEMRLVQ